MSLISLLQLKRSEYEWSRDINCQHQRCLNCSYLAPKIVLSSFMPCSHAVAVAIARTDVAAKQGLDALRACARKSVLFRPEALEGTLNFLNSRDFVSKFKV